MHFPHVWNKLLWPEDPSTNPNGCHQALFFLYLQTHRGKSSFSPFPLIQAGPVEYFDECNVVGVTFWDFPARASSRFSFCFSSWNGHTWDATSWIPDIMIGRTPSHVERAHRELESTEFPADSQRLPTMWINDLGCFKLLENCN